MNNSRANKTIRNSIVALIEQSIYTVLSFVCRTVFIYTLGRAYLGFNGLFSDILNLLSLAELGFGTAILYAMYKPMATGDRERVGALLYLYKRIYFVVGVAVSLVGITLTPFLDFFISDIPNISGLETIYLLFLFNTTSSYFFAYKKSILISDQKSYIASLIFTVTTVLQNVFQIIILLTTQNYILYLVIQVICTVLNNLLVSLYVDKHYPYLKQYKSSKIKKDELQAIFKNVRAMFLSKISSAVVSSTDNILISKFVSTITLGLYSNYLLFTNILRTIFTKIFEGLTGSVGNLVAIENSDHIYKVFKRIWFINFWLVGFASSSLFILVNPFISLWIGEDYLLKTEIVFIICLNFYMRFIRNTFITFTDTYGLFVEFRVKCIMEALLNMSVSLYFVWNLKWGVMGVLCGTFISNILTNFWYEPYVLFKKKFEKPVFLYFITFLKYSMLTVFANCVTTYACNRLVLLRGWGGFALKTVICVFIINGIYFVCLRKTEEFYYLVSIIKAVIKRN